MKYSFIAPKSGQNDTQHARFSSEFTWFGAFQLQIPEF